MNKKSKIYIAGHNGMVGSAIVRNLKSNGYHNLIYTPYPQFDLINQKTVENFFRNERPEYVIDAAAKVGGINANNTLRAQFIYENLMIQNNIIHQSYVFGVKKLIFLGSSCIYPKMAPQPLKEEYLLTGKLEQTNEPYAIAKISGIKMCENYYRQYESQFYSIMPTNSYGPNDNYDLETSHVLPALIRKFHEAIINNSDNVILWGTGKPLREFIYVDDIADAAIYIMDLNFGELYENGISQLNVGSGKEISIRGLAQLISKIVGYDGQIIYDKTKPDGTPRKLMDNTRLNNLGWKASTSLEEGLKLAYNWFSKNYYK